MIYGNIKNQEEFNFLPENIKACFEYINKNDLKSFEKGSYEINGKEIFVNIVEYETTTRENRFWESHKQYLDLHLVLENTEIIDVNFISNMEQKEFVENDDFLPMNGNKKSSIVLDEGDFLICYPNDAHMTGIKVNESKKIKKAIFKVKI